MIATIEITSTKYRIDLAKPIDISIPLRFAGPQPSAYGVEPATSTACEYGDLVGDTRRGGSCNFERVSFIPHCNGTHTECVGHITTERISVRDCLQDVLVPAVLVSVEPEKLSGGDFVIYRQTLENANVKSPAIAGGSDSLIIRTLPNDEAKLTRPYGGDDIPPYFSADAMRYIIECGFKHLLVDLPSIDRIFDEGKLENHRIFWNVEAGSFETNSQTRVNSTVTEMIYVPNEIEDGTYLLNLQIAPFDADASPARPVIFRVI